MKTKSSFLKICLLIALGIAAVVLTSCERDDHDPNDNGGNGSYNPGIGAPTPTTDPGVVINGVRWATRNVYMPGTFATNPHDAGMFYQWNRNVGWSTTDPLLSSNGDTIWDDSTPSGTVWYAENCPCPPGWRVPTREELESLKDAGSTRVLDWNDTGVNGRVVGTYPNQIFLPVAGWRRSINSGAEFFDISGTLHMRNGGTYYWSSTPDGDDIAWFLSSPTPTPAVDIAVGRYHRASGFSVRCVSDN